MLVKVRRWDNNLAVRIPRRIADKPGLAEGDVVRVNVLEKVDGRADVDLEGLPTFGDEDRRASLHHDRFLYGR